METTKILLLEPKLYLREFISNVLKTQDCLCDCINSIDEVKNNYNIELTSYSVFIINLDLFDTLLPKYTLADKPVIELPPTLGITNKIYEHKAIDAMNRGLDDCITYPFNKEFFLARIKSLARRPKEIKASEYKVGDFEVIRDSRELVYKSNKIDLSKKEYMILTLLLENPNRIITKNEMIKRVWTSGKAPGINTIDVHISNIRKKLLLDKKRSIHTIHGLGYKLKP